MSLPLLPFEIIEKIFLKYNLSLKDVISLCSTCKHLSTYLNENKLWMQMFSKRWPILFQYLQNLKRFDINNQPNLVYLLIPVNFQIKSNWSYLYHQKYTVTKEIYTKLNKMVKLYYESAMISYVKILSCLGENADPKNINENSDNLINFLFILDSLSEIFNEHRTSDMTIHYYAQTCYRVILHSALKDCIQHPVLMSQSLNLQINACLFEQWCKLDDNCFETLKACCDSIVFKVKSYLQERNIGRTSIQLVQKKHFLTDDASFLSADQVYLILNTINKVIYDEEGFRGYRGTCGGFFDPEKSFISRVISDKQGSAISLSVIYQAIAQRFNITLSPIYVPSHFLLLYKNKSSEEHSFYVDAFHRGLRITESEREAYLNNIQAFRHYSNGSQLAMCDGFSPLTHMCKKMVHAVGQDIRHKRLTLDVLEMASILSPEDVSLKREVFEYYNHLEMNPDIILNEYQTISVTNEDDIYITAKCISISDNQHIPCEPVAKLRNNPQSLRLKFYIGGLIKIIPSPYNQLNGVVVGWDVEFNDCNVLRFGREEMQRVVKTLQQPFYSCLLSDGSSGYFAEEHLKPLNDEFDQPSGKEIRGPILNNELGRYFTCFSGCSYIPNKLTLQLYPHDFKSTE